MITYAASVDTFHARLSKLGFDPISILTIIQAVIQTLMGVLPNVCPKPPTPSSLKSMAGGGEGYILLRLSLRSHLISQGYARQHVMSAVDGVIATINESSEEEIGAFIAPHLAG